VLYRNSDVPYIEQDLENIETAMMRGECCSCAFKFNVVGMIIRNDPSRLEIFVLEECA
jgi:hypothetical protein